MPTTNTAKAVVRWWAAQKRLPELYWKLWDGAPLDQAVVNFLISTPGYKAWLAVWEPQKP